MNPACNLHCLFVIVAAILAAVDPAHATDGSSSPATQATTLSYVSLMKLPVRERIQLLESAPERDRDEFVGNLPGDRRAVLLVDPEDCSGWARTKRTGLALAKRKESLAVDATKTVGSSLARGALNFFSRGLGDVVGNAARANEAVKGVSELREYRDICDLSLEERSALLSPKDEAAATSEASLMDAASKLLAK